MENKIYIVEMCESCEYYAFSSDAKAKEFMLKKYLKNEITQAKHCAMHSDNVDEVVNIIKIDLESIMNRGYLEDSMYMSVADLDADVDEEEIHEGM